MIWAALKDHGDRLGAEALIACHVQNKDGCTAPIWATAIKGHGAVAEALIAAGAIVHLENKCGSALIDAVFNDGRDPALLKLADTIVAAELVCKGRGFDTCAADEMVNPMIDYFEQKKGFNVNSLLANPVSLSPSRIPYM
eukprot:SAG22_NODE_3530_length_1658_cov_2.838358_2_plen_140_part_00